MSEASRATGLPGMRWSNRNKSKSHPVLQLSLVDVFEESPSRVTPCAMGN
jgi:hypothetical protein